MSAQVGGSGSARLRADALLLLAAAVWGSGFVAQRVASDYFTPFFLNGLRFSIATILLLPFLRAPLKQQVPVTLRHRLAVGALLFGGSTFQQYGVTFTTAGHTAFITGLYVVIVPFLAALFGARLSTASWGGSLLAACGLYLLSIESTFEMSQGDFLVLIGAFIWAGHVMLVDAAASKMNVMRLAIEQFAVCAVCSFIGAVIFEPFSFSQGAVLHSAPALWSLLYLSLFSSALAFTLQIYGQREAPPTDAAIIMSAEALFGAIGGVLLLGEHLSQRGALGCAAMFTGMMITQLARLPRR